METIVFSPNKETRVTLTNLGELPFGPLFGSLKMDQIEFIDRIFGFDFLWSPDSRYFAIQEWLSENGRISPNESQLVLIDMLESKESVVSIVKDGWIKPMKVKKGKIIYRKEYFKRSLKRELEMDFDKISTWIGFKHNYYVKQNEKIKCNLECIECGHLPNYQRLTSPRALEVYKRI